MGRYRLRARVGWYSVLIGESNVAIDPAIGGYGVETENVGRRRLRFSDASADTPAAPDWASRIPSRVGRATAVQARSRFLNAGP